MGSYLLRRAVTVSFAFLITGASGLEGKGLGGQASDYHESLAAVNNKVDIIRTVGDALCPITSLILTCGDDICEPGIENQHNCAADCVSTPVKSFNHQVSCESVNRLYRPKNVNEIASILTKARTSNLHVRVVGGRHSANRQLCTDGFVISMEKFDDVIGIVKESDGSESVVVEAGITMGALADWLHDRGRSLGYVQLGFRMASIGGAIATAAHGSSHKHTAVISNSVRAVTLITADGTVMEIDESDGDLLRALRAHLGLFGVVARVKLKVVPQFRLHVKLTDHDDDTLFLEDGIKNAIEACDYSFINWFPEKARFVKGCGIETKDLADWGAENTLLNPQIPPGMIVPYKVVLHYGMCYEHLNALLENLRYNLFKWLPPFQKKRGFFGRVVNTDDVVGYSHRMMSSKFIEADEYFFQHDREIAVPLSLVDDALTAMRAYITQNRLHFPLFGVFLRFAPSDDKALLAHTTSIGTFKKGEPVALMEIITPEAVGFPDDMHDRVNRPFEELTRMLIAKFGGRPHWGKNKDWAFSLVREQNAYHEHLGTFQAIAKTLDPGGMFANDFTRNAGLIEDDTCGYGEHVH